MGSHHGNGYGFLQSKSKSMKLFYAAMFTLVSILAQAQTVETAIDTSSLGVCRNALKTEFTQKFKAINKNISTETSAQKRVVKSLYTDMQSDFMEKIKHNDFICNDPSETYLQKLMAEILSKNNIPASSYRILLSRDSEANGYNTGDGTVVINYGLFLTLENEDELVFVISHEIGHQHLNHVYNGIERFAKLSTSEETIKKRREIQNKRYGKGNMTNDFFNAMRYQNYSIRRKNELQADSLGLAFYKKTLRNNKASITVLQKLDLSDEEQDSLTVSDYKAIFGKNGFKVKESYFAQEESLFKQYDAEKRVEADSLKTHPDCATRIQVVTHYTENAAPETTTVSKTFSEIKTQSVNQNLINLYIEEAYGLSLYEALKVYKKDSGNAVAKNLIYQNLSKILAARTSFTINRYVPALDNKRNTSSLNRFITFVNNIKTSDFEILMNSFKS